MIWLDNFFAILVLIGCLLFPHCSNKNPDAIGVPDEVVPTGFTGIVGSVVDTAGRPLIGASVRAEALTEPRPAIPEIAIVTDRNGRYTWRLLPGEYAITVVAEGFGSVTKHGRVLPGKQRTLNFQLKPAR